MEFAIDVELLKASRSPAIMADAGWEILTSDAREVTGNCLVDEAVLCAAGVSDFDGYKADPTAEHVQLDLFIDP